MSNYNEEENDDPNAALQEYRQDMAAQNTAANGTTNVNVSGNTSQATVQEQKPSVREGWVKKGENFYTFANYDNLLAEYKKIIPRQGGWKSSEPLKDPVDGKMYIFGMTVFDNGGTSVWSKLATSSASGTGGGQNKPFYKTIDIEEGNIDQVKAFYASVRDNRKIMFKRVDSVPITITEVKPDGTKVIKQELRHVLELQERIY